MAHENFYDYVTSDVDLEIRPGDTQATFMLELQAKIDRKLWKIPKRPNSPFLQTIHAAWRSFKLLQKEHKNYIQNIINRIDNMQDRKEIPQILKILHQHGSHPLFQLQYDPDLENPKREILYLRINDPSFSDEKSHVKYTNALFEAFDVTHPNFKVHQLELNVNEHRPARHDLQSAELCFNPQNAERLSPHLRWINDYFYPMTVDRFSIDSRKYFEKIGKSMVQESLDKWRGYLMFHWLHHISSFFSDTESLFFDIERSQMTDIQGGSRKGYIMDLASNAWWQDAGFQFVDMDREHLEKCRLPIIAIAECVRNTLHNMFQKSSWQDSTKKDAVKKLRKMEFIIGWSDVDFGKFPKISDTDFFDQAILKGWKYQYQNICNHNDAVTNRKSWRCTGYNEVNAFYSRELNVLFLPASLFYAPFFHLKESKTPENFGAIGSIIAHEIYHGFDYDSRMVTSEGRLKNWWSSVDNKNFLLNARKTIKLYSARRSIIGSHRINGRLTLSENIADMIALQMAWYAFLRWYDRENRSPSPKEMKQFFHMFGLSQTQIYSKHALEMSLKTDYHALSMARVNIPVSIFPPFLELYNVKRGDAMYTKEKDRPNFISSSKK